MIYKKGKNDKVKWRRNENKSNIQLQHIEKDHKNRKDIQEYTGLGQVIILKEKTQEDKATYDKIFNKGYRHTEKHLANIIKTVYNEYILLSMMYRCEKEIRTN